jgi:hypothetical protein
MIGDLRTQSTARANGGHEPHRAAVDCAEELQLGPSD